MPRSLFRLVAKGAVGFVIALTAWLALSPLYAQSLAAISQGVIRLAERPVVTSINPRGTLMVVERRDFPATSSSRQLGVESTDITFNFILLATLFAVSARALSDRNVFGFLAAAAGLVLVHVAAVVAFVKAYYALSFGAWSAAHYGAVARTFWGAAPYFYSVIGVYGFAFALWWVFRAPPAGIDGPTKQTSRRARRR